MMGNSTDFSKYHFFNTDFSKDESNQALTCSRSYKGILILTLINDIIHNESGNILFVVKNIKEMLKLKVL